LVLNAEEREPGRKGRARRASAVLAGFLVALLATLSGLLGLLAGLLIALLATLSGVLGLLARLVVALLATLAGILALLARLVIALLAALAGVLGLLARLVGLAALLRLLGLVCHVAYPCGGTASQLSER
jgi:hypothetical protein